MLVQVQRPEFRPDLIAKPVTVAATRLFEVRDPGTGRSLRFSENGYSIAYLLDGKRTLEEVLEEFSKQRGIQMTLDKLSRLVDQLALLDCLVCDPERTVAYSALQTVAVPVLGDGGVDEALATMVLAAEAFKDYYTIMPDDDVMPVGDETRPAKGLGPKVRAQAVAAPRSKAVAAPRSKALVQAKAKPVPPPLPRRSSAKKKPAAAQCLDASRALLREPAALLPALPPLPAWPPLENSIRRSQNVPQDRARGSLFAVEAPPRAPRAARVHARSHGSKGQALWLAGGFLTAALFWASWAILRLA